MFVNFSVFNLIKSFNRFFNIIDIKVLKVFFLFDKYLILKKLQFISSTYENYLNLQNFKTQKLFKNLMILKKLFFIIDMYLER